MDWGKVWIPPPYWSTDQRGSESVTLADLVGVNEPYIAALALHGGAQNAIALHVHHNGVDGALVALRVQSHAPHDVGAGLRSLLNQSRANGDAGESGEVHLSGVVN